MITIDPAGRKMLVELANKYELKFLILFGSQVSGRVHEESDYDVAYLSKRGLSTGEESQIIFGLMPILKIADERLISLVDVKTASPLLLYSITSGGQLLFERELTSFFALKIYAWKVFIDTQPFRDNYFRIVKERIQAM